MALRRLKIDQSYRFLLASPDHFADWRNPTVAELNANPTNDPSGSIFNVTCALNTDGTQFDLDDPTLDETLTFCQDPGNGEVMERSATVAFQWARATERWDDASSMAESDGYNASTLIDSLLRWRGVDYFAILSIGKGPDAPFAAGDRIKMAEVSTDWATDESGTGNNVTSTQTFAKRSRLVWNWSVTA